MAAPARRYWASTPAPPSIASAWPARCRAKGRTASSRWSNESARKPRPRACGLHDLFGHPVAFEFVRHLRIGGQRRLIVAIGVGGAAAPALGEAATEQRFGGERLQGQHGVVLGDRLVVAFEAQQHEAAAVEDVRRLGGHLDRGITVDERLVELKAADRRLVTDQVEHIGTGGAEAAG